MFGFLRKRLFVIVACVLVSCLTYYISLRQIHLSRERRELAILDDRLHKMLEENNRLQEIVLHHEDSVLQKSVHSQLEKWAAEERGLAFKAPVNYEQMSRSELTEYLRSKIGDQYSPEEFQNYEKALKRLGLLPMDTNLNHVLTELLSEQIAAFYDPETHKLYTFKDAGLRSNMDRTVLAHELIHALQDQNFEMKNLSLREKLNDDASLAASSILEGDATFHMMNYLLKNFRTDELLHDLQYLGSQDHQKLSTAPLLLRESLLFPYDDGLKFVQAVNAAGGLQKVNRLFTDPPASTEQILHPEKYLATPRDDPKNADFQLVLPPTWKKIHQNVVGEFGVKVFFSQRFDELRSRMISEGWGGDRYDVYDGPGGSWIVVWKTVWDSEKDAREFFDGLDDFYHEKYHLKLASNKRKTMADAVFFAESSEKQNISKRANSVTFISAPDLPTLKVILDQLHIQN